MSADSTKIVPLNALKSFISDNQKVAIGGDLSAKEPMALIREIIRQRIKGLTTIGGAHGIDVDLLCAGGAVKNVHNSFVGFEFDFGIAPNYRRLVQEGKVIPQDTDCDFILNQLRAAEYGVPFMPMPLVGGTDLLKIHPEYQTMTCPYTGQKVTIVPALKPDVAIIHAHYGDKAGNVKLFRPHFADLLISTAAETTIVSVEEIISEEKMKELNPELPGYHVDALIHIPFGAHPTSCYPNYVYDREHIFQYIEIAKKGQDAFNKEYLDKYVYGVKNHEEYLELIGGAEKMQKLQGYRESISKWKEAFNSDER
ncbi:MAG: CoA-transferase [Dehalobacterium sp.]